MLMYIFYFLEKGKIVFHSMYNVAMNISLMNF